MLHNINHINLCVCHGADLRDRGMLSSGLCIRQKDIHTRLLFGVCVCMYITLKRLGEYIIRASEKTAGCRVVVFRTQRVHFKCGGFRKHGETHVVVA